MTKYTDLIIINYLLNMKDFILILKCLIYLDKDLRGTTHSYHVEVKTALGGGGNSIY